ncbi:hypothetical protein NOCA2390010 [metagenome]|uniref:Uncharacterized protein n=1 Tax=metagenome TaxID=256318 RepID=A0A2P2C4U4_9ZZZZ
MTASRATRAIRRPSEVVNARHCTPELGCRTRATARRVPSSVTIWTIWRVCVAIVRTPPGDVEVSPPHLDLLRIRSDRPIGPGFGRISGPD